MYVIYLYLMWSIINKKVKIFLWDGDFLLVRFFSRWLFFLFKRWLSCKFYHRVLSELTNSNAEIVERVFIHVCQLLAESERVVGHCGYMRILFAIARVPGQSGSGHVRSAGRLDFFDALKTWFAQQFIEVGNDLVQQP